MAWQCSKTAEMLRDCCSLTRVLTRQREGTWWFRHCNCPGITFKHRVKEAIAVKLVKQRKQFLNRHEGLDQPPIQNKEETYNRRQNELRQFALNWAFLRFTDFKRRKVAFPPPSPPCNVVPMFELSTENNKHPNYE